MDGGTQETFDVCDGHPTPDFQYHYHRLPMSCIYVDGNQVDCVTFRIEKAILKSYIIRHLTLAALGGPPPHGPNVSQFHAVFLGEKFGKIVCWRPPRVGASSYGESWISPCSMSQKDLFWLFDL